MNSPEIDLNDTFSEVINGFSFMFVSLVAALDRDRVISAEKFTDALHKARSTEQFQHLMGPHPAGEKRPAFQTVDLMIQHLDMLRSDKSPARWKPMVIEGGPTD